MDAHGTQTIEHAGRLSAALAAVAGLGLLLYRLARTPVKAIAVAAHRSTGKLAFPRELRMIHDDHAAIGRIEPALAEIKGDIADIRADVRMLVARLIVPEVALPDEPLGPFPHPHGRRVR